MNSGLVSIIGRPNAGKSTFLNAVLGEKIAAVSPKPQTTRNRIMGVLHKPEGQIVFLDTPGIHRPHNKMHKRMVDIAYATVDSIDAVLLMVDGNQEFGSGDEFLCRQIARLEDTPVIVALNKVDKVNKTRLLPLLEKYNQELNPVALVPISALKSDGLDRLLKELFAILPEAEPLYPADTLTDQTERQFVSEIVREKVFQQTRSEVPYCSAVIIDAFEESEKQLHVIASIIVERKTQKGIVIGRGGAMLKKIGTAARIELEQVLGTKVFLELFVKVKEQWREDERLLNEFGIN